MKVVHIHCEGLPCPQPVLQCRQAIEDDPDTLLVVSVDNEAAKENVTRFLESKGYAMTSVKQDGSTWKIAAQSLKVGEYPLEPQEGQAEEDDDVVWASMSCTASGDKELARTGGGTSCHHQGNGKTLVVINASGIGTGDDMLGKKLMENFIHVLPELGETLWRIILLNGGVKLATQGSPVLEALQALEHKGVSILVCGTCLECFHLMEEKQVGETTNMLDVVTSMQLADKVLSL
ncbi:MAG: sulfurtransferase-like selenium metabolism protein YedF [Deltaproteobacteria bacterium]|nr:MAG: sulfurtransferase-like selenium metabolism protein YedF [Deltaproteobacteria bacterium]